jgi:hypothetical protein
MATFEDKVQDAARRIDPSTARMEWWYAEGCDPYGQGVRPDDPGVRRKYFLLEPEENVPVLVSDVRRLHPEIPDAEWDELMRAAAARDDTFDPFPWLHSYRRRRAPQPVTSPKTHFVDDW